MKLMVISFLLFLLPLASALSITEVELNPEGSDYKSEWVEIYSEKELNLDGYYLENNDGDTHELNVNFSSFLIIQFTKQWLDNSDERVILKKENEIIDETIIIKDDKNDNLAWSLCNTNWVFIKSTKESENACEEDTDKEENPQDEEQEEEPEEKEEQPEINNDSNQIQDNNPPSPQNLQELSASPNNEKIILSPPTQETTLFTTKKQRTIQYIIIAFTTFTIIIIILLALRKL